MCSHLRTGVGLVALGLLAAGAVSARANEPGSPKPPATPQEVHKAVKRGLSFLVEDAAQWRKDRSCSTCHKPELFFTDGFSRGWSLHESELPRKTPNLLNVGWQRSLFFDGRAKTLEEAILWHGGEATLSIKYYRRLKSTQRTELIAFLQSLVAPGSGTQPGATPAGGPGPGFGGFVPISSRGKPNQVGMCFNCVFGFP